MFETQDDHASDIPSSLRDRIEIEEEDLDFFEAGDLEHLRVIKKTSLIEDQHSPEVIKRHRRQRSLTNRNDSPTEK